MSVMRMVVDHRTHCSERRFMRPSHSRCGGRGHQPLRPLDGCSDGSGHSRKRCIACTRSGKMSSARRHDTSSGPLSSVRSVAYGVIVRAWGEAADGDVAHDLGEQRHVDLPFDPAIHRLAHRIGRWGVIVIDHAIIIPPSPRDVKALSASLRYAVVKAYASIIPPSQPPYVVIET